MPQVIVQDGIVYTAYTDGNGVRAYNGLDPFTGQWVTLLDEITVQGVRYSVQAGTPFFNPNNDIQSPNWGTADKTDLTRRIEEGTRAITFTGQQGDSLVDQIGHARGQALAANTLAALATWVYDYRDPGADGTDQVPEGFFVLAELDNPGTGFFGVSLYQVATGDIVIIPRGTDMDSMQDWLENFQGHSNWSTSQAQDMEALINLTNLSNFASGTDVYLAGHSLGGGLSTAGTGYILNNFTHLNVVNVTFGSGPQTPYIFNMGYNYSLVAANTVNFVRDTDPLDMFRSDWVGQVVEIEGQPGENPLNPLEWGGLHAAIRYAQEVINSPWALTQSAEDLQFDMRDPIVIDLDGDGVETRSIEDSNVFIDFNWNGNADHVAWAAPDDGVLFLDIGQDNLITDTREVTFRDILGGVSDLDCLRLLDQNEDGKIDQQDVIYQMLKVWSDANDNGVQDQGEIHSLSDLGIASIAVTLNGDTFDVAAGRVRNTTEVTWVDGQVTAAWDMEFKTQDEIFF